MASNDRSSLKDEEIKAIQKDAAETAVTEIAGLYIDPHIESLAEMAKDKTVPKHYKNLIEGIIKSLETARCVAYTPYFWGNRVDFDYDGIIEEVRATRRRIGIWDEGDEDWGKEEEEEDEDEEGGGEGEEEENDDDEESQHRE